MKMDFAHDTRPPGTPLPPAIILSHAVTGLATARGIADGGVEVYAAVFSQKDPIRFSRCCRKLDFSDLASEEELIARLIAYARNMKTRPVVIPTRDEDALLLAKNYSRLSPCCLLWKTPYEVLKTIINKNGLYTLAKSAGLNTVPSIVEPDADQLAVWIDDNPGPYFLKPFYAGIPICELKEKNLLVESGKELIDYVVKNGSTGLVIQRFIQGGDGYILDSYGLCDGNGKLLTIASHRRWRQCPPDTGITSYGEIPANPEGMEESVLFDYTSRLLEKIRYHGIFGIEWLQDRKTGELYLIDFNARPFTSIGHLTASGLNLPLLAHRELAGDDLSDVARRPLLKHMFWIDFLNDLWWVQHTRRNRDFEWSGWIKSLIRSRGHAYLSWRDPGPGISRLIEVIRIGIHSLRKKLNVVGAHPKGNGNCSPLASWRQGSLLRGEEEER